MAQHSELAPPDVDNATRAESLLGQTLGGRYRIVSVIGAGGMGAVYRAQHLQLGKTVAVKVLHAEMTAHREAVLRFEREAMVSARVQHENVVNATDSGRLSDGSLYLVLEYVSGRTLRDLVDAEGRIEPRRACAICCQIARALSAAHRADIVHRDLKPANVMLIDDAGATDSVRVLDFGIAKVVSAAGQTEPLTQNGSIFGTPEYMSPEQARGEVVDHRADLYALGVILYELLAGRPPFESPELVAILLKHVQEAPPPLPEDVPQRLAQYVMTLLDKLPERRPADAEQVARALSPVTEPPPRVVRPASSLPLPAPAAAWWVALEVRCAPLLRRVVALTKSLPPALRGRRGAIAGAAVVVGFVALVLVVWPGADVSPQLLADAAAGKAPALKALSAIPDERKSADVWVALVQGYEADGQAEQVIALLSRALVADRDLADKPELQSALRRAADVAESRESALSLAASEMGPAGVDILFDVWSSTGAKTPATRVARRWLDSDPVRAQASAAVNVALQLREARGCEAAKDILPRAKADGDLRALLPLRRLEKETGCGFLGLEDCFPCLRGDPAVADAIAAVQERKAPEF